MQRYDAHRRRAIAVIESLRAGIPTRLSAQSLPDLRVELTNLIRHDLNQFAAGQQPEGRLVWGPYGQGKTHALTTIEHLALELGFGVSRVALSREISCHHLFNFYGRAAAVIRIPDSKTYGIGRAFSHQTSSHLADSPLTQPDRYAHPLPAIILEDTLYTTGEEQELLFGDLMGTRLAMPELKRIHRASRGQALPKFEIGFRVTQHGSAYFGVMADAIQLCGYKGWVILIDEVELIGRLGRVSRLQAYRNLHWLLNWSHDLNYPIYTVGVVASSLRNDLWFRGTHVPTAKSDRMMIPALAKERLGETVEAEMKTFFEKAISPHCPTLKPLDQADLLRFLSKLVDLHRTAYAWDPQLDLPDLIQSIGNQPLRTHIRATLEALDMAYLYHEAIQVQVSSLVEGSITEDEAFFRTEESTPDQDEDQR